MKLKPGKRVWLALPRQLSGTDIPHWKLPYLAPHGSLSAHESRGEEAGLITLPLTVT